MALRTGVSVLLCALLLTQTFQMSSSRRLVGLDTSTGAISSDKFGKSPPPGEGRVCVHPTKLVHVHHIGLCGVRQLLEKLLAIPVEFRLCCHTGRNCNAPGFNCSFKDQCCSKSCDMLYFRCN